MLPRRTLTASWAALLPAPVLAQEARPIRLVVAFPPGGSADALGRLVAPGMAQRLGSPMVVENRAGAGGAVGAGAVAQAAPDGQTLLLDTGGQTVNPHLLRGLAFDYARAFAPVTMLVTLPLLLVVRPEVPAADLPALLAWLRADATRAAYGSVGVGARTHLAMAALLRRAGIAGNHVPYRGGAEQVAGLLRGDVAMGFTSVALAAPLLREGRLRAVAASGAARVATVPTVAEQGFPGFALGDWIGLLAPAGTPAPVVARMADAAREALAAVAARLPDLGMTAAAEGPAAFARFLSEERAAMAALIAAEGIRPE